MTPPTSSRRESWLEFFLSDLNLRFCALFTLLFVCLPPEGLSVELCLSKRLTDAPCPACGMTRCGSNLVRGRPVRALQYHPFGVVVLPVITLLGLLALFPRRWREAVRTVLLPWADPLRPVYHLALAVFLLYGLVRWALVFGGWVEFPPAGS